MRRKTEYKYWFAGDEKPKTLPKGCEWLHYELGKWAKETEVPASWRNIIVRRWKITRTRPRKTRDRRLLEALLKDSEIIVNTKGTKYLRHNGALLTGISYGQEQQLIAIKEAMKKGNK